MIQENHSPNKEALSIVEACAMTGLGRTKLYEAISKGNLIARKCGKRTLILKGDLLAFLSSLPVAA